MIMMKNLDVLTVKVNLRMMKKVKVMVTAQQKVVPVVRMVKVVRVDGEEKKEDTCGKKRKGPDYEEIVQVRHLTEAVSNIRVSWS